MRHSFLVTGKVHLNYKTIISSANRPVLKIRIQLDDEDFSPLTDSEDCFRHLQHPSDTEDFESFPVYAGWLARKIGHELVDHYNANKPITIHGQRSLGDLNPLTGILFIRDDIICSTKAYRLMTPRDLVALRQDHIGGLKKMLTMQNLV